MTRATLPRVFANALDKLTADGERYFGHPATVIEPLALADREAAQVLRARLGTNGSSGRHIFVKVFKPRGPSTEARQFMRARVINDFAMTSEVHDALNRYSDLAAVRAIACFPDDLILVTEEAHGTPFDSLLEQHAVWQPDNRTLDGLEHIARRIGAWLTTFQGIRRVNRRITIDGMREYLDVRLKRLVSSPKGALSELRRRSVLSYFDAISRDVAVTDLTEVLVHGDIAPSNILVDGRGTAARIVVIDFAMTCTGGMHLDVARLFTQFDFLKAKPKFRPQTVARLQTALLGGFNPALRPSHPLFKLFELQHVICHVANLSLNPAPPIARLYNLYQLHRHHRWLRERAA